MPRQAAKDSTDRVQCPECHKEMSDKSLKRHMDKHLQVFYPCNICDKRFSQAPNRDAHIRTHTDVFLVCDACNLCTKQNSEMTRHKQDQHGHPRRGDAGSKKVAHKMISISDGEVGVSRVKRRRNKVSPYARPAAPSYTCESSPEASSSLLSPSSLADFPYSLSPSPSHTSLSPSPSLSPSYSPGPYGQYEPAPFWNSELDIFRPSDLLLPENQFNVPAGLDAQIAAIPEVAPFSPVPAPSLALTTPEDTPALTLMHTPSLSGSSSVPQFSPEDWEFMDELQTAAQAELALPVDLSQWTWTSTPEGMGFMNQPLIPFSSDFSFEGPLC